MKDAISAAEYNNDRGQANMLKKRLRNVENWLSEAKEKAVCPLRTKLPSLYASLVFQQPCSCCCFRAYLTCGGQYIMWVSLARRGS
jgi:hypothetical protein